MFAEKYRSIGLNILYYRRLKGLSQEALSIKAGLTRSYISKILISDLPPGTESAQK